MVFIGHLHRATGMLLKSMKGIYLYLTSLNSKARLNLLQNVPMRGQGTNKGLRPLEIYTVKSILLWSTGGFWTPLERRCRYDDLRITSKGSPLQKTFPGGGQQQVFFSRITNLIDTEPELVRWPQIGSSLYLMFSFGSDQNPELKWKHVALTDLLWALWSIPSIDEPCALFTSPSLHDSAAELKLAIDGIFYFPDRERIVTEQKIDFEILTDLYVLRSQESEKGDFKKCPSVCMSVCPLWRS